MTHQAAPHPVAPDTDAGRQLAQLCEALQLVERIAGSGPGRRHDVLLDEAARVSDAYDRALPVVQRRFDALATETAAWAAAGVEALLAASATTAPRAAAERLAVQLDRALGALTDLIHR